MPTPDGNASEQSADANESTATSPDTQAAAATASERKDADQSRNSEDQDGRTYTHAEVDKLVQDRVQEEVGRIVRKKAEALYRQRVGDVDIEELKAKAGESQTLEDRVAAMERRAQEAEASALRSRVANEYQISAEDAELFLTGTDEDALIAQAKRLAEREAERKQRGPRADHEGRTPKTNPKADETREFAQFLTGRRT